MVKSEARFDRESGQGESFAGAGFHGAEPVVNRIDPPPKKPSRIQQKNRETILASALEVFSAAGFRGATIDRIADGAGMSKPNLLYYFPTKTAIYVALLEDLLQEWLQPLADLAAEGDPVAEIAHYIEAKLEMSRARPAASKLFANEILHGAPMIGDVLRGPMKALVDEKAQVIEGWVKQKRLAPVDPYHVIFMIWAVTQHYADFDVQIRAVLGGAEAGRHPVELGGPTIARVFFEGLRPRSSGF